MDLLSVSVILPVLDIIYNWNHTISVPFLLNFSLSATLSKFIDVVACICDFIVYCLIVLYSMDISCFIHSSGNDRLSCLTFKLISIMIQYTLVSKFLCRYMLIFYLGTYLGLELLNHIIPLCLFEK